jgi:hypothetical protein
MGNYGMTLNLSKRQSPLPSQLAMLFAHLDSLRIKLVASLCRGLQHDEREGANVSRTADIPDEVLL